MTALFADEAPFVTATAGRAPARPRLRVRVPGAEPVGASARDDVPGALRVRCPG